MLKRKIQDLIKKIVPPGLKFSLEYPPKEELGDYSVFLPLKIAQALQKKIEVKKPTFLEKVEVVLPGFLNFHLKKEFLQKQVNEILKKEKDFGKSNLGKGKKVQVEFISANPTGSLHIGNGRGGFTGDVLANVLEFSGYKVEREYYVNDAKNSNQIQELGKTALGKGSSYLTKKLKTQISKLKTTTQISKLSENEVGYLLAHKIQKDNQKFLEKKLKIKFDNWIYESSLYKKGEVERILELLKKKKLLYKKAGALWLKTGKFGDDKDRVLVRKNGEPTYFLSDIAYHKNKYERGFKKVIDLWGADHAGYVGRMKAASRALGYKKDWLEIIICQLVRLVKEGKEVRMSKRKGVYITLEELVEMVGLDVARFFFLMRTPDTHMDFDLEAAREHSEKNPVYYVQYAHARIQSILKKSEIRSTKSETNSKFKIQNSKFKLLSHPGELKLIKQLVRFPEIIEETSWDYQVQRLPQYTLDLSTAFHQFYRDCRVLTENQELTEARLALILATKIVLKNTLVLMGISAPERM